MAHGFPTGGGGTGGPDLDALFKRAVGLHRSGAMGQARAAYEQIIAQDPDHGDALTHLGILAHQGGQPAVAADFMRRAVAAHPQVAAYHNNLGSVLVELGDSEGALAALDAALRLEPGDADGHFNRGGVLMGLDRHTEAEAAYRRAVELRPNDAEAHYNLGNALKQQGRLVPAVDAYEAAIRLQPDSPEALNNLGNALQDLDRLDAAVQAYERSVALKPTDAKTHLNYGDALRGLGRTAEALERYGKALALDGEFAEAHRQRASVLHEMGRGTEALEAARRALRLQPESTATRRVLATVLSFVFPADHQPGLVEQIIACMEDEGVDPQAFTSAAAAQLLARNRLDSRPVSEALDTLYRDPLLLPFLQQCLNTDHRLEPALTALRRDILERAAADGALEDSDLALTAALATQCFANEYLWDATPEESAALGAVRDRIEGQEYDSETATTALVRDLMVYALYAAPLTLSCARLLGARDPSRWPASVRAVVQRTLLEPLAERKLVEAIPSLGLSDDPGSVAVRAQYEENPYPRWLNLPQTRPVAPAKLLARRFPHFRPPAFLDGPLAILVAGCGTGQEPAALARRHPKASVLGVDLSRASLAYGARMAQRLEIANLEFAQADVLALAGLDRRFHLVTATGVLHHMDDPVAGWRVLAGLLVPGGVMHVGLYSEQARAAVTTAREQIAAEGLGTDADAIRGFRKRILTAPSDTPLGSLRESEDLYTVSACRDLLFHARESCFTLPRIATILDELGLDLVGLDGLPPGAESRYRAFSPDDATLTSLADWDRFEADHPDTFAGMYRLWVQKPLG